MTATRKDHALLHLLVVVWSFTAIFGALINLTTPVMVAYRTGIAAIAMLLIIRFKHQNLNNKQAWQMLLTGSVVALHWLLFFGSAKVSNISISLAGLSTQALFTSFIEPILNRKKIQVLEVFFGLSVILGLYLIFKFEFSYSLGLWMSIGCAFAGALFSVLNGLFAQDNQAEVVVFYEMTGASLTALVSIPFLFNFSSPDFKMIPSAMDWIWLLLLSLGCTVFPFTQSVKLMKKISAFVLNLALNLEPIYGIVLAYLIFGEKEKMTSGFYIGGAILLFSVAVYPYFKRKLGGNQN